MKVVEIRPGTAITCHCLPLRVTARKTVTCSPVALRVALTVTTLSWRVTLALGRADKPERSSSTWSVVSAVGSDCMVSFLGWLLMPQL